MTATSWTELSALHQVRKASKRRQSICGGYARYECLKAEWIAANWGSTPAEYDRAMHRIARECGV